MVFLDVLGQVLQGARHVTSGVVLRQGCAVLFVVSSLPATRSVEIGCEFTEDGWWYSWATDSRTIAPVEDTARTADVIIRNLREA
jgi:hypothetical protein